MRGKRYIVLAALFTFIAMSVQARMFEQGEKIYVNADQTFHDGCFNWANDNAKISLYLWKKSVTGSEQWVTLSVETGALFSGDVPAGDFDRCIIVRGSQAASWTGKWNQTGNLTIPDVPDRNYISKFWEGTGDASADWLTYSPAVDKIGAFVASTTEEAMKVCQNALGYSYTLHPKLKADKSDYDYENVACHSWYVSTDKSTWSSVDGLAGLRDGEQHKDTFYILPNTLPSNVIYFYLYSSKQAGRRLLKITPDAADCDYDCMITSFEVACSEVNANDTTYTLDGMIAFGEANGDLVVTCEGQSTTISGAKSPQIFSIPGLRAATSTGKTTVAEAKFTGNTACTATATVNIPNATQGIVFTHIDQWFGETKALNPSGANYANEHKWYINGEEKPEMQGAQVSIDFDEPNVTRYTYREFNPPIGTMDDLMNNGNYESDDASVYGTKWQKSVISDYEFWGKYPETGTTQINFYSDTVGTGCVNPNKRNSNGFAVVKNANNFYSTFAKLTAREGEYFALFDAASDGVEGKKAWYTNTTISPSLKLQKGTTYLFSFWAANINNYGEMDNAAKLQFQIEYNGKTKKLGRVLDLGSAEFRNNRWHQCSATFLADADATNVTISVVNLNTNKLFVGNDFALDDIQFRAVSSATRSVRIQQVFEVETHDPYTCVERMYRKWDNVLFINNGDNAYKAFQWYKNGKKIDGETQQRYYTGSTPMAGTSDLYNCVMTKQDGTTEEACAHTFDQTPRSAEAAVEDIMEDGLAVYPTQVASGATVTVQKTCTGSVQATLLTMTGQTLATTELRDEQTILTMPVAAGIYMLQLQTTTTQRTVKINVY